MMRRFWAGLLGLGVYILGPYLAVQVGNWGLIREGRMRKREVALTFDDGPDPVITPAILNALQAAQAQATFFVSPERAEAHPELIRRMQAEGHQVEAHAEVHCHAWLRTPWGTVQDVTRAVRRISIVTGERVTLHRPAHGAYTLGTILGQRAAGVTGVHWSIEGRDWHPTSSPERVREHLNEKLLPGAVIVLHDAGPGAATALAMLPGFLTDLKARGYSAVTLRELPGATPQGQAELKRHLLTFIDRQFDRAEKVRSAGDRADNLLRLQVTSFPLEQMTLQDGTALEKGDPVVELHVNSALMVDLSLRPALKQATSDFQVVASDLHTRPEYAEAKAIFTVGPLAPLLRILKFEIHDVAHPAYLRRLQLLSSFQRWGYGSEGQARTPQLCILGRQQFLRKYLRET